MHANKREDIKEVTCGNIAAAAGLRVTTTGDTLCDEKAPVVLELMDFPAPVISIAIEPKTQANQEKLGHGAGEAGRSRTRRSACKTDPETGPDHHLRDGRAAPRDHRRPAGARVQGRGLRRAARRSPTARPSRARPTREGKYIRQTGGRGAVRPRRRCTSSRPTGKGDHLRGRAPSAARSRASSCRRSRGACARRWRAACWPATR